MSREVIDGKSVQVGRGLAGTRHAPYLVPRFGQLTDQRTTDGTGRAGYEDAHDYIASGQSQPKVPAVSRL